MQNPQLIQFLQEELAVSSAAIAVAIRCCERSAGFLPIVLWQHGFLSIDQLDRVFDWLETG